MKLSLIENHVCYLQKLMCYASLKNRKKNLKMKNS